MARGRRNDKAKKNGATLGFEATLWAAADKMRNNMDAAEYKHVVLGLIFLKYISDAFEAKHAELDAQRGEGADPEDPDEYRAKSIFWVPPEARWQYLKSMAPQPTIGQLIDGPMSAIEQVAIIQFLNDVALGREVTGASKLSDGQWTTGKQAPTVDQRLAAATTLCKKFLPDLKAAELSGPGGGPVALDTLIEIVHVKPKHS